MKNLLIINEIPRYLGMTKSIFFRFITNCKHSELVLVSKHQTPNTKHQTPNTKHQTNNSYTYHATQRLEVSWV